MKKDDSFVDAFLATLKDQEEWQRRENEWWANIFNDAMDELYKDGSKVSEE